MGKIYIEKIILSIIVQSVAIFGLNGMWRQKLHGRIRHCPIEFSSSLATKFNKQNSFFNSVLPTRNFSSNGFFSSALVRSFKQLDPGQRLKFNKALIAYTALAGIGAYASFNTEERKALRYVTIQENHLPLEEPDQTKFCEALKCEKTSKALLKIAIAKLPTINKYYLKELLQFSPEYSQELGEAAFQPDSFHLNSGRIKLTRSLPNSSLKILMKSSASNSFVALMRKINHQSIYFIDDSFKRALAFFIKYAPQEAKDKLAKSEFLKIFQHMNIFNHIRPNHAYDDIILKFLAKEIYAYLFNNATNDKDHLNLISEKKLKKLSPKMLKFFFKYSTVSNNLKLQIIKKCLSNNLFGHLDDLIKLIPNDTELATIFSGLKIKKLSLLQLIKLESIYSKVIKHEENFKHKSKIQLKLKNIQSIIYQKLINDELDIETQEDIVTNQNFYNDLDNQFHQVLTLFANKKLSRLKKSNDKALTDTLISRLAYSALKMPKQCKTQSEAHASVMKNQLCEDIYGDPFGGWVTMGGKHPCTINSTLQEPIKKNLSTYALLQDMHNTERMYIEDNKTVFIHGQKKGHAFLEDLYTALVKQIIDANIPDDYLYIRYLSKKNLAALNSYELENEQIKRKNLMEGVKQGNKRAEDLLFMNAFIAGGCMHGPLSGACSLEYFLEDQNIFDPGISIRDIFKNLKLEYLFKKYERQLIDLQRKYMELNQYGRMLQIAIPNNIVDDVVYLSAAGGRRRVLKIPNHTFVAASALLESVKDNPQKFDKQLDDIEFAMVLTKDIVLNPHSGIRIKSYDIMEYADENTEIYLKCQNYKNEFKTLISEIVKDALINQNS